MVRFGIALCVAATAMLASALAGCVVAGEPTKAPAQVASRGATTLDAPRGATTAFGRMRTTNEDNERTRPPRFEVDDERWSAIQSNGWIVIFDLVQEGTQLRGDARAVPTEGGAVTDGDVELGGRVQGNSFMVVVAWEDGVRGKYRGVRGPDGRLRGGTVDLSNSGAASARWVGDKTFSKP